jgi:hypothetical protein
MDRDFVSHPPTFFEDLANAELSDRFYSSLGVVPTVVSTLISILCFILVWNEHMRTEDQPPLISPFGFQLFIAFSLFMIDFVFRIKDIIPAGKALRLFEGRSKKSFFEILTYDWRELMVAFFWIINSFINPTMFFLSGVFIVVILVRRSGIFNRIN